MTSGQLYSVFEMNKISFKPISLSVSLFVSGQHYSKSYERIVMKFCGGVLGGTMKN